MKTFKLIFIVTLLTSSTINLNTLQNGLYLMKVLNHLGVPVASHRLILQK